MFIGLCVLFRVYLVIFCVVFVYIFAVAVACILYHFRWKSIIVGQWKYMKIITVLMTQMLLKHCQIWSV